MISKISSISSSLVKAPSPTLSASLEEELGIPKNAFLSLLGGGTDQVRASLSFVDEANGKEVRIPLDVSSSIRWCSSTSVSDSETPKCLVVGRQASVADIRLDHKSISRKHAAIFYHDDGTTNQTVIQLLPLSNTKHGTFVNSQLIPDNGKAYTLSPGDVIQFGTFSQGQFKLCCSSNTDSNSTSNQQPITTTTSTLTNMSDDIATPDLLTGRAKREAEIAAMTASLDEIPTYTKHSQQNEEQGNITKNDHDMELQRSHHNASSSGNVLTHVVSFTPMHTKCITALAVDPAGSRLVTGSNDYTLQLYDFGGMDAAHKPFLELRTHSVTDFLDSGQFPITDVHYTPTGDKIVVSTTSSCAKVFTRDGQEVISCIKGDVYVTDMAQTKGHVNSITSCQWHPYLKDIFITASLDGSVRMWDISKGKMSFDKKLTCNSNTIYKVKNQRGQKTQVLCLTYHPSGKQFAVGTSCGSIQLWNCCCASPGSTKLRPDRFIVNAHDGAPVTSLVFSPLPLENSGRRSFLLASRAGESQERDDTVRLWYCKMGVSSTTNNNHMMQAAMICKNISSSYEKSNVAFSPDGNTLCIGCSSIPDTATIATSAITAKKGIREEGVVQFYNIPSEFYDSDTKDLHTATNTTTILEPIGQVKVGTNSSIVKVLWHPKLNQIICGAASGEIRVVYDPEFSTKGVLLSSQRAVKQKNALERLLMERKDHGGGGGSSQTMIITPNALPMFRDPEKETKRKRTLERMDPVKTKRPEPPTTGKHLAGGRSSVSINFQQFVVQSTIKNKNIAGKDPREELFKYQEGKSIVDRAYDGNVKVLAEKTAEEEEEEAKQRR